MTQIGPAPTPGPRMMRGPTTRIGVVTRPLPGGCPVTASPTSLNTMTNNDLVVQTQGLTKRYGSGRAGRIVVDAVSMTVRRGEVYGFLGPNGAGKTTTLRMMLGL